MSLTHEQLIQALSQIQGRLQPIATFTTENKSDQDQYPAIRARYEIAKMFHEESQDNLRRHPDEQTKEQIAELSILIKSIDALFVEIHSALIEVEFILQQQQREADRAACRATPSYNPPQVGPPINTRLPKISIPSFNGNRKEWPGFFDLFRTLVHENNSFGNIEKFQYLRSYVTGEPLSLINGIKFLGDNYPIAYQTLVDRYENKRALATHYWQILAHAPKATPDSSQSLRELINTFSENVASLENFHKFDKWDFTLFNWLLQKIDPSTRQQFEMEHNNSEIPTYDELKAYIERQCRAMETSELVVGNKSKGNSSHKDKGLGKPPANASGKAKVSFVTTSGDKKINSCILCNKEHFLYQCDKFQSKTAKERYDLVKQHNRCLNCLHSSHKAKDCKSTNTCRVCKSSHHTLLHFDPPPSQSSTIARADKSESASSPDSSVQALTTVIGSKTVLLATVQVTIFDGSGKPQIVRGLLDGGSQSSIMLESCRQRLGLGKSPLRTSILGLGQTKSNTLGKTIVHISNRTGTHPKVPVEFLIVQRLCGPLPTLPLPAHGWEHTHDLELADPLYYHPMKPEILLGADVFTSIILSGRRQGQPGTPLALESSFGWILMGPLASSHEPIHSFHITVYEDNLNESLRKLWELEDIPKREIASKEEVKCERLFVENCTRDSTGRFVVALPFVDEEPLFENSRSLAISRLTALERRLKRNDSVGTAYGEFMQDYLDTGHMRPVENSSSEHPEKQYYIPHHCVLRPESTTTKLRVVFDASSSVNGDSLNDHLLVGPKLQKDIFTLLLHFRLHVVVLTADIKQMYRQIRIVDSHLDYQRIVWRFAPDKPIQDYQLQTVTYGMASSPFLALRTIVELAKQEELRYPDAAAVLASDTYVDDIVTGSSSPQKAEQLVHELTDLLQSGGFALRKWASNRPECLQTLPSSHLATQTYTFEDHASLKVLGLRWIPSEDCFSYHVEVKNRVCTKRSILSELSRIFDPLGFLAPLTLLAKYLIQELWSKGCNWDDIAPPRIADQWKQYSAQLSSLTKLRIPRLLFSTSVSIELHVFCDASEKGFAAVVYFRVEVNHTITVALVCAKSRVAPLKRVSIPRLELCAATLAADLVETVKASFERKLIISKTFGWSDSRTALAWIRCSPHRWKTFISNRTARIQEVIPPASWSYVPTSDNPADCASRGLLPEQLLNHSLWWAAPSWLKQSSSKWPSSVSDIEDNAEVLTEERQEAHVVVQEETTFSHLLQRYSSLPKILRIVAYCRRFAWNSRNPNEKKIGSISELEQTCALKHLLREVQHECFKTEIAKLQRKHKLTKPLANLDLFIDTEQLLRVGGRLRHSQLPYNAKHQLLLPSKHRLVELIIFDGHAKHLHPGINTLHYLLRQNYWIVSGVKVIRLYIKQCFRCYRLHAKPLSPKMGDLPTIRVTQVKAFQHVGVDFGGPFITTISKHRGVKSTKSYVCLFVCLCTKAIHLEVVSDLTTDAFIASLRRFVARRGKCTKVYSDQGTNFVGAVRVLNKLMQEALDSEGIEWSFNPPAAPNFGGLWEAGIKGVKTHLTRTIGEQCLTFEELYTVCTQIEALLNSRPLYPLSSDPNDLEVLSPGHFLTLAPLTVLPESNLLEMPSNRLKRWDLLQQMHQQFWKKWHLEYLNTLQQRTKWQNAEQTLAVGDLVLIKDDQTPPMRWKLARVAVLHPGKDDIVRVATVKTATGRLQRPLNKLCPLPKCDD